jgi:hypothetical protein
LHHKKPRDFWILHNLIKQAQGHHAGIFVVGQDNDPTRDLTAKGIVSAIRKLEKAGVSIQDEVHRIKPLALTGESEQRRWQPKSLRIGLICALVNHRVVL